MRNRLVAPGRPQPAPQPLERPDWLEPLRAELLLSMYEGYRNWRLSRRNQLHTIEADLSTIDGFLRFAQGIPGEATPEHFERWSANLFHVKRVAASTQRRYQSSVRGFFDYVSAEPRFRNEVRRTLGVDVVQVSTPENSIVHKRERELERENLRRSFTPQEAQAFFEYIDREIAIAWRSRTKSLHVLQRDKVLFSLIYDCGLRASEVLGVNLDSFERNPNFPEFGDFGAVWVYGKGAKHRLVVILDPSVAQLLAWYLKHIRPKMLNGPDEDRALFLSERGHRLTYHGLSQRFNAIRDACFLPKSLVPHCLRHTAISNAAQAGMSIEAIRQRSGHEFAATSQTYMHLGDTFVQGEAARIIGQNLRKRAERDE
jgi:site-specific recombinase XerD